MLRSAAIRFDDNHHQQNRKVFNIYNFYRLALSLILLVSYFFASDISSLGILNPELYLQIAGGYLIFNLLVLFLAFLPKQKAAEVMQFIVVIILDIITLTMISYTCGGVSSGMAHMLTIPVAAGSILFQNRVGTFLAAVATLSVIYSEFYLYVVLDGRNDYYFQAGLLGLTLFLLSLILQYLSGRIRQKELLARQQARNIRSLEEMNYQVLQRMQAGIIVVDADNEILNINSSAIRLLTAAGNKAAADLPDILLTRLEAWKTSGENQEAPFQLSKWTPQLQVSFSYLQPAVRSDILIFLEDYSWLASRAQQLKLISLGRLTASIAHEVRNPLGAISHASQLLQESRSIDLEDQRLLEIIESHVARVNSIIENVLRLSRHRESTREPIDLKGWLWQFRTQFSNSYKDGVLFDLSIDCDDSVIHFNQSQLEQILTNLCENGIRYSRQQTHQPSIMIEVRRSPQRGNIILDVVDDGPGVSPQDEDHIFEPFFTTQSGGTGLGLFICREICEANQAQLTYLRNNNGKSCFRINFVNRDSNLNEESPGKWQTGSNMS